MNFPFRHFALGLGLAAAGGVAVWSSFNGNQPAGSMTAQRPARPASAKWLAEGPVKPLPLPRSRQPASASTVHAIAVAAEASFTTEIAAVADPTPVFEPTREELEFRALKVEQHANKQLKNLLGVLNLTDDQQDRIFSTLARHSDYYHPALRFQNAAGGDIAAVPVTTPVISPPQTASPSSATNSPSPATADPSTDPVLAELAPDQVEVYERYRSERDAFWAGVVTDIENKLNSNGK